MIKNAELASPRITFELGKIVKQANQGDTVTVYQHTPYREDYNFTGSFEYLCDTIGTFEIRATVTTPNDEELISNPITIIVV